MYSLINMKYQISDFHLMFNNKYGIKNVCARRARFARVARAKRKKIFTKKISLRVRVRVRLTRTRTRCVRARKFFLRDRPSENLIGKQSKNKPFFQHSAPMNGGGKLFSEPR